MEFNKQDRRRSWLVARSLWGHGVLVRAVDALQFAVRGERCSLKSKQRADASDGQSANVQLRRTRKWTPRLSRARPLCRFVLLRCDPAAHGSLENKSSLLQRLSTPQFWTAFVRPNFTALISPRLLRATSRNTWEPNLFSEASAPKAGNALYNVGRSSSMRRYEG